MKFFKLVLSVTLLVAVSWAQTRIQLSYQATWPPLTVATLPSSPYLYQSVLISDGSGSTPCATGGGALRGICVWTGSAWTAFGFSGSSGSGPTLQTNGVNNGTQSLLNLTDGTNASFSDDGLGNVTLNVTAGGSGTVNTGTANQFSCYLTTGTAVSGCGSDFTFLTHTLTGGALAILDLHAASVTAGFLPPTGAGAAPTARVCAINSTTGRWTCGDGTANQVYVSTNDVGLQCSATGIQTSTNGTPNTYSCGPLTGDASTTGAGLAVTVKSVHWSVTATKTTTYTVGATDYQIPLDATGGAFVVNLPAATGSGRELNFKKLDSTANAITITPNGADTIDGNATQTMATQNANQVLVDSASGKWYKKQIVATGGDLSGPANNATIVNGAVTGAKMANNTVGATQLGAQYSKLRCEPGLGDGLNAIAAGTYLQSTCYNDSTVTWTITGIKCLTDNSGTSTLNAAGNTLGALLTGAITCTPSFAAGTQSANILLTAGDYIKFTFVSDGASKQTTWVVSMTQ